jgi:hypothetical protein
VKVCRKSEVEHHDNVKQNRDKIVKELDQHLKDSKPTVFDARKVVDEEKIETEFGEATASKGHYVVSTGDSKFVVNPEDFESNYESVK